MKIINNSASINETINLENRSTLSTSDSRSNKNTAPKANAGEDQNAIIDTEITLGGSESIDSDGDQLTFRW